MYYKNYLAKYLGCLEMLDKFLEIYTITGVNQEEMENLNNTPQVTKLKQK